MYSRGICRAREGSKDRELPVLDRYRTEGENAFMMEQSLPECGLDEGLRSVVLMNGGGRIQCHSTRRWAFMRIPIEHPAQRSAAKKMWKKHTRWNQGRRGEKASEYCVPAQHERARLSHRTALDRPCRRSEVPRSSQAKHPKVDHRSLRQVFRPQGRPKVAQGSVHADLSEIVAVMMVGGGDVGGNYGLPDGRRVQDGRHPEMMHANTGGVPKTMEPAEKRGARPNSRIHGKRARRRGGTGKDRQMRCRCRQRRTVRQRSNDACRRAHRIVENRRWPTRYTHAPPSFAHTRPCRPEPSQTRT